MIVLGRDFVDPEMGRRLLLFSQETEGQVPQQCPRRVASGNDKID